MKKELLIITFLMGPVLVTHGQETNPLQSSWEDILELAFPLQEGELNEQEIRECLTSFLDHPVDINSADRDKLSMLFILSPAQMDSLLKYREQKGRFLSVYELKYVPGFDVRLIHALAPFIKAGSIQVNNRIPFSKWFRNTRSNLLFRYSRQLELKEGYNPVNNLPEEKKFLGPPGHYAGRYRAFLSEHLDAGILFDKDPGEALIWLPDRSLYGFDHYSYHFTLYNLGPVQNLTAGDYQLRFGQGLVLGNGFFIGKGAETISSVKSKLSGIRPYNGFGETDFFRGLTAKAKAGALEWTVFYSHKKKDAVHREEWNENEGIVFISSIPESGLHRNISELENRKNLTETVYGMNLSVTSNNQTTHVGTTLLLTNYDKEIEPDNNYYNQFAFRGKKYSAVSVDYNYFHRIFNVFGELAVNDRTEVGMVNGIMALLSKNIETSLLARYYTPGFYSLFGNALSENTAVGNEMGIYWGMKILPFRRTTLHLYHDLFRFPWLKYQVKSPSAGNEFMGRLNVKPGAVTDFTFQYRLKAKEKNIPMDSLRITGIDQEIKSQYWFQGNVYTRGGFQFRSRFQYSHYVLAGEPSSGMAFIQDAGIKKEDYSVFGRVAFYSTDDYNNRQYVYERDILYSFEVPAYYGKGMRIYLTASYRFGNWLTLWMKAGKDIYPDRVERGSGADAFAGKGKTEVKIQTEFKF